MLTLEEIFPPFALRIESGGLELRVLRDEDFPELVELVRGGIAAPDMPMPFLRAWHEEPIEPGAQGHFPATSLSWWWTQRARFAPDHWELALTVRYRGELVGMQDLRAESFPLTRSIETGSWLGRANQGRGLGTLMRQMVVGFAFDELGAVSCESAYIVGNHASAAVSRKTGYVDNGRHAVVQHTRHGKVVAEEQRVIVTPETYKRPDQPMSASGVPGLRRFFSIDE